MIIINISFMFWKPKLQSMSLKKKKLKRNNRKKCVLKSIRKMCRLHNLIFKFRQIYGIYWTAVRLQIQSLNQRRKYFVSSSAFRKKHERTAKANKHFSSSWNIDYVNSLILLAYETFSAHFIVVLLTVSKTFRSEKERERERYWYTNQNYDSERCDLMLSMGTSAMKEPHDGQLFIVYMVLLKEQW